MANGLLKEYGNRMNEGQNYNYYMSIAPVSSSLYLGSLRKKGLEELYIVDSDDVYAVQHLKDSDGKKLKTTTKKGFNIEDEDGRKKDEELKAEFRPPTKLMKKDLGEGVVKDLISSQMADALYVLTTSEYGWSAIMERIMKSEVKLYFERGVIDSDSLPLNVIAKKLVRKCGRTNFDLILMMFYEKCPKLGVYEDTTHRLKVTEFMRIHTTETSDGRISRGIHVHDRD